MLEDKVQDAQDTAVKAETCFESAENDQGRSACLHLHGTCAMLVGDGQRALEIWDKALGLAKRADSPQLEYDIATSIHNVKQAMQPVSPIGFDPIVMQPMMPVQPTGSEEAAPATKPVEIVAAPAKPKGLDPTFVRKQLMVFVKDVMATDDELELDSPFMEAGMDSLSSVSLMSMVAKEFQMALSPSLVFDFPTVRA